MTSGTFTTLALSSIVVNRTERQRKELRNIDELAESIMRIGLIHPPVVTRDGVLIAGERRLTAVRALGWTAIPVQYAEDLTPYELQCIEFEENVKRLDLTWQEEVDAVARFHELKATNEPEWTQERTAEELGLSPSHTQRMLAVAKEMDNEKVRSADKLSAAVNLVERSTERRKATEKEGVASAIAQAFSNPIDESDGGSGEAIGSAPRAVPMICASFHEWQPQYTGPKFNLIHCDFPYGINVAKGPRQNAALQDHYEDGYDVYDQLLDTLAAGMDNVVAESANLIFWFSMDYYQLTLDRLTSMGWTVNVFPLIWHKSDNAGVAPDPQRWPRRTYETAFVASRGDRKLTQAGPRSNSFAYPGKSDDRVHISQKPLPMLRHFMSMYCDEYSIVLDPTAGSGSAIKAAEALGAMSCLGLELSQDFYEIAVANWETDNVTDL